MNETFKLILSLSLSGSILAGLLFALKPFIKHRFSRSIQYYAWVVILFRLVLPFSLDGSVMNIMSYGQQTSIMAGPQAVVQSNDMGSQDTEVSPVLQRSPGYGADGTYTFDVDHSRYFRDLFSRYIFYIWLLGAITAFVYNLAAYVRFSKYIKSFAKPAFHEEEDMLISLMKGQSNVKLLRNPCVTTPMLIGIINPLIIIPDIEYSQRQLKYILLHEIAHHKRFDIAIKWLTVAAVSIHWFNPLAYFMKREINHICELSCDEVVIKDLNPAEKQAYGDTLIDVVSESRYPAGALQATMSEEKKTLKERLVAIMRYNKKSKSLIAVSCFLLLLVIFGALFLGPGMDSLKATPPKIYISGENVSTKEARTGSFVWKSLGRVAHADSDHPVNFEYGPDNIVSVEAGQQLAIGTQKIKADRKYEFTMEEISVYKDGEPVEFHAPEPGFLNGCLYLQSPPETGEYIYSVTLKFGDKGTVSYGFVVRVDMLTYDLEDIAKYKTPYVGDHIKVSAVSGRLPLPDKHFKQQYISMKTRDKPYILTVYYEPAGDNEYHGTWPLDIEGFPTETNLSKNALVLFSMIDNVDEVVFAFRNSKSRGTLEGSEYDSTFAFQRKTFEAEYGDLSLLGKDLKLLENALKSK